jgi:DNA polymerase (family X)
VSRPSKSDVVEILGDIGTLLEYHGESPFKSRAYEAASRALADETSSLADLLDHEGALEQVRGIGKSIASVIREIAATGTSAHYQELLEGAPAGLQQLLRVPGLGVKKIRQLHEKLGIGSVEELEEACKSGHVEVLPGFGRKSVEKLLSGIDLQRRNAGQWLYPVALGVADELIEALRSCPAVSCLELAGSLRRCCEIVHDIDLLAVSANPKAVMGRFTALPGIGEVVGSGDTKSSIRLQGGIQADLRVVTQEEFPTALVYFTGSKSHNTQLRARAESLGLKLNEYGLFKRTKGEADSDPRTGDKLPLRDEADLYRALGLQFIPPEMREGLDEIDAAHNRRLPDLVRMEDYRGALHCHSTWSDGAASIRDMALAARDALRLEYLAVCDHSEAATYARGVRSSEIPRQHAEIDKLNEELGRADFRILKGCECDILADGSLDYPETLLETMDIVVASVHSRFQMGEQEMTARLLRAVENPYTDVLGHPTGRLLLGRDGYAFDVERVLRRAAERGTAIEINADPNRLDLDWRWCRRAKELGCRFSINPDAHSVPSLRYFRYGISVARKGWLEKADITNCLSLRAMLAYLARAQGTPDR